MKKRRVTEPIRSPARPGGPPTDRRPDGFFRTQCLTARPRPGSCCIPPSEGHMLDRDALHWPFRHGAAVRGVSCLPVPPVLSPRARGGVGFRRAGHDADADADATPARGGSPPATAMGANSGRLFCALASCSVSVLCSLGRGS